MSNEKRKEMHEAIRVARRDISRAGLKLDASFDRAIDIVNSKGFSGDKLSKKEMMAMLGKILKDMQEISNLPVNFQRILRATEDAQNEVEQIKEENNGKIKDI